MPTLCDSMGCHQWKTGAAWLAVMTLLLGVRLPFLAPALDNTDSINFDLGVHDYDPGTFQPHPPGFPVYIALAKVAHAVFADHATALSVLSAIFSSIAIVPLFYLFRVLLRQWSGAAAIAAIASVLTLLNPTLWFNSVRPMSDLTAFFFITSAQCLLLVGATHAGEGSAQRRRLWLLGAACAGLAVGVRLQAVWCVGPLLVYTAWRSRGPRVAGITIFTLAVAAWLLPMIVLTGGPMRFGESFYLLLADALPGEPLFSRPTLNYAALRVSDVLVSPWQNPFLAAAMLGLAAVGAVILAVSNRRLLATGALVFGPYAGYHYLLQETAATRYAVPTIPAVAVLASIAIVAMPRKVTHLARAAALLLALGAVSTTLPALFAYGHTISPTLQALDAAARFQAPEGSLLFGHHAYERYLHAAGNVDVLARDTSAKATLLTYWKKGGRRPVLFLRDPRRQTLLFFGPDGQQRLGHWTWPAHVRPFFRGEQPNDVALVQLSPPRWMTESGVFVSLEAGPVEQVLREPAVFYVRSSPRPRTLLVSGVLHQQSSASARLTIGGRVHAEWRVGRSFTVRTTIDRLPGPGTYVPLQLAATSPAVFTDLWVEPVGQPVIRPSEGFSAPERDEQGQSFRWIGREAASVAYVPPAGGRVRIEGWIPSSYYDLPMMLGVEWNGRPLEPIHVDGGSFVAERDVAQGDDEGWGRLVIRAPRSFVPHEWQRNGDSRTLSAKIYSLAVRSASETPKTR